jgi:hypothetical protein
VPGSPARKISDPPHKPPAKAQTPPQPSPSKRQRGSCFVRSAPAPPLFAVLSSPILGSLRRPFLSPRSRTRCCTNREPSTCHQPMERRYLPISWQLPAYDQQAPGCPDRLTIHAADFGFTHNDLKAEFVPTPSGTSLAPRRAWSRGGRAVDRGGHRSLHHLRHLRE